MCVHFKWKTNIDDENTAPENETPHRPGTDRPRHPQGEDTTPEPCVERVPRVFRMLRSRPDVVIRGKPKVSSDRQHDFFVVVAWTMNWTGCKLPSEASGFGMTLPVQTV